VAGRHYYCGALNIDNYLPTLFAVIGLAVTRELDGQLERLYAVIRAQRAQYVLKPVNLSNIPQVLSTLPWALFDGAKLVDGYTKYIATIQRE